MRGTDLVSAVRQVAAGQSLIDEAMRSKVTTRLKNEKGEDQYFAKLSAREREVLDRIAEGKTNRQIGEELFLAEKTIKNYVSSVLMKMGLTSRTEAAVYAVKAAEHRPQR